MMFVLWELGHGSYLVIFTCNPFQTAFICKKAHSSSFSKSMDFLNFLDLQSSGRLKVYYKFIQFGFQPSGKLILTRSSMAAWSDQTAEFGTDSKLQLEITLMEVELL